jgi:hypothetical protein
LFLFLLWRAAGGGGAAERGIYAAAAAAAIALKFHPKHEKRKQTKTLTKRTNRH